MSFTTRQIIEMLGLPEDTDLNEFISKQYDEAKTEHELRKKPLHRGEKYTKGLNIHSIPIQLEERIEVDPTLLEEQIKEKVKELELELARRIVEEEKEYTFTNPDTLKVVSHPAQDLVDLYQQLNHQVWYATWPALEKGKVIQVKKDEKEPLSIEWFLFNPEDFEEIQKEHPETNFVHLRDRFKQNLEGAPGASYSEGKRFDFKPVNFSTLGNVNKCKRKD